MAAVSKTYASGGTSRTIEAESVVAPRITSHGVFRMWDVVMLALGFGFFAAAIGYTYACERL
jgi:hypothetical protein